MPNYVSDRASAQDKHRVRRAAIVAAAADVMRRDGVARCTVRAVAKQAGVNPGTIHYYFSDAQEIVDLGYGWLTDRYFAGLERLRFTFDDPVADFWHFMAAYTEPWRAHPRMPILWAEYFAFSSRNQRTSGVVESHQRTVELFASFLEGIDDHRHVHAAAAVWRFISGTISNRETMPISLQDIFGDLALLTSLEAPRVEDVLCDRNGCWCGGGSTHLFAPQPKTVVDGS